MQRLIELECGIQHYAWGSDTVLPELLGIEPDGRPYAELWAGDHPVNPSVVRIDGVESRLDEVISSHPAELLGADMAERRTSLPFLVKILAIAQPLSLQAHPDLAQARAGFEREDRDGVARDAPDRCYRDDNHKPELIIALGPFEALCGFRDPHDVAADLARIGGAITRSLGDALAEKPDAEELLRTLGQILSADADAAATLSVEVADGLEHLDAHQHSLMSRLLEANPEDHTVLVALLLRHLRLAPGDALFLGPGVLHAYLEGTGVEVMAASDNVLRGGLTPKHVDADELLGILRPEIGGGLLVTPQGMATGVASYQVPVDDFVVLRLRPSPNGKRHRLVGDGPAIVLCSSGEITVASGGEEVVLGPGGAVLAVAPNEVLVTGEGVAWHVAAGSVTVTPDRREPPVPAGSEE